jgi:hypothetical protein
MQAASPFAAAPGMQAASPFAAAPGMQAASPFAAAPGMAPPGGSPFNAPMGNDWGQPLQPDAAAQAPAKTYDCARCEKKFSSEMAMIEHSKDKHKVVVVPTEPRPGSRKKVELPDLPPYVPSPVDMSATAPYGSARQVGAQSAWAEVELFPTALSVSNMDVVGVVSTIEQGFLEKTPLVQLTVRVAESDATEEEELVVRCFGDVLGRYVTDSVSRGTTVAVSGTLRLNESHDAASNKYFANPVIHVAVPCGSVHALD